MFYKNPGEKTNKQRPSLVHDICSWYADAGETLPDHSSLDTDWPTFLFVSKDVAEFIFWMRKVSPLFHLVITWWSIGDHLVPIWRPNGDHLVTTWGLPIDVLFPCGQHMAIYSNPPIWYPIIFFQPHNIKNIANGTTDPRVEFISQVLKQISIKSNFKISIISNFKIFIKH